MLSEKKKEEQAAFEKFVFSEVPLDTRMLRPFIKNNIEGISNCLAYGYSYKAVYKCFIKYFNIKCSYGYFSKVVKELIIKEGTREKEEEKKVAKKTGNERSFDVEQVEEEAIVKTEGKERKEEDDGSGGKTRIEKWREEKQSNNDVFKFEEGNTDFGELIGSGN